MKAALKINNRQSEISIMKTAMMIAVVLYHSMLFFSGDWFTVMDPIINAEYLSNIARWMNTFHVQAFTMASGFLFYCLAKKHIDTRANIRKRAKRLLLPYLFVSLFWAIPIGYYLFRWPIKEIIERYLLAANPNQLWFLIMLFLVCVFFELVGKKIKISTKNLIILYFITTVSFMGLSYFKIDYFQLPKVAQYILYFYLGGYIFYNKKKITKKQTAIMGIIAAILYASSLSLNASSIKLLNYIAIAIMPIISILEVSVIYYICLTIIKKKRIDIESNAYRVLEENSFGIYLFHQQIIYFTILFLNGVVHPIIQATLSFVISMTISLTISMALRKRKPTKVMFGL